MWTIDSDGYRWVHPNSVITTPNDSSPLHFKKTIQTSGGEVLITVCPSVNGSDNMVGVDDGWFSIHIVQTNFSTPKRMQATYRNYFTLRRFSYERQRSRLHPSMVGVRWLALHQFLKWIYPNPMEYWWIFAVSVILYSWFIIRTCLFLFAYIFVVLFARFFPHFLNFHLRLSHNDYFHHLCYQFASPPYVR